MQRKLTFQVLSGGRIGASRFELGEQKKKKQVWSGLLRIGGGEEAFQKKIGREKTNLVAATGNV